MAAHSRILAWRIPRTEEPGGTVRGVAESAMTEHAGTPFLRTFRAPSAHLPPEPLHLTPCRPSEEKGYEVDPLLQPWFFPPLPSGACLWPGPAPRLCRPPRSRDAARARPPSPGRREWPPGLVGRCGGSWRTARALNSRGDTRASDRTAAFLGAVATRGHRNSTSGAGAGA